MLTWYLSNLVNSVITQGGYLCADFLVLQQLCYLHTAYRMVLLLLFFLFGNRFHFVSLTVLELTLQAGWELSFKGVCHRMQPHVANS